MKITVCIPSHNYQEYIVDAVKSVLSQTYSNFELIIIDSGTDLSEQYIKTLKDDRIRFYRLEGSVLADKLNMAIKLAKGEYFSWLSADDKWDQDFLKQTVYILENKQDVDFVYTRFKYGEDEKTAVNFNCMEWVGRSKLIAGNHLGIFWLFRIKIMEQLKGFEPIPAEDWDFTLRASESGIRFYYLDKTLGWLRDHKNRSSYKLNMAEVNKEVLTRAAKREASWIK